MRNYDRIKYMSIEEMAEFFHNTVDVETSAENWMDWLTYEPALTIQDIDDEFHHHCRHNTCDESCPYFGVDDDEIECEIRFTVTNFNIDGDKITRKPGR